MNEFMKKVLDDMKQDQQKDVQQMGSIKSQFASLELRVRSRAEAIALFEKQMNGGSL